MSKETIIKSTEGLHASLAIELVKTAQKYTVDLKLQYEDKVVDLKSILGLMSLAVPKGENVKVIAEGNNASEAVENIKKIFQRNL